MYGLMELLVFDVKRRFDWDLIEFNDLVGELIRFQ